MAPDKPIDKPILVDNEELTRIAKRHFGNRSILYPEHSLKRYYLPTPLPYLTPFDMGARHLLYQRRDKILASATLLDVKVPSWGQQTDDPRPILYLYGLCVRPGERRHGFAQGLVKAMFDLAAHENKTLQISPFTALGAKYLAPQIARIHAQSHASVPLLYSDFV